LPEGHTSRVDHPKNFKFGMKSQLMLNKQWLPNNIHGIYSYMSQ